MMYFTAVIPLLGKVTSVGENLNWGLQQSAGSTRDSHRCTGHAIGLRKSEALTINKESSPLSVVMLCFTAVIPLLGKRPVLVRSQTGDFHKVQEAAGMPTDLLDMRSA
jgi:hypothetical protein